MSTDDTPGIAGISLAGTHVLCTGGLGMLARTFGLAAARAGARVSLVDLPSTIRDPSALAALGQTFDGLRQPELIGADITRHDDCARMLSEGGVPDVVINFAGIHHPAMDLVADDPASLQPTFDRAIAVNLSGAFAVTAACAKAMAPRRTGHLIHLCSNGSTASLYGSYGYVASKHGLLGIVRAAAAQLAPFGVRVNGVAPGTVITDLNRHLVKDASGSFTARAKSILAHTPTKRFATADGVAETILALCVPQRHLTGNIVFCDDGYSGEGHSWPAGNEAVYASDAATAVDLLYKELGNDG